jgi:V/A-type H+-transporting ATPase subunit I
MSWREALSPVRMSRIAVVAPVGHLRQALVGVAGAGTVELDRLTGPGEATIGEAARRLQRMRLPAGLTPLLAPEPPDLDQLERDGRADLLAGEAQLVEYAADAIVRGQVVGLTGWTPASSLPDLAERLGGIGAAAVPLALPRGVEPPTAAVPGPVSRTFGPLVGTYTTVPYADVDPTLLAGLAYVTMFGAMFGDAGHGMLLVLAGLALRMGWLRRWRTLDRLRPHWMFVAAAGLTSALFGVAYGEFFGPTGVVPTLWLAPMEQPVPLLLGGVALGVVLLACAYALGTVNRVREGGWGAALYAPSGLAGSMLFAALGLGVLAWYAGFAWLAATAGLLAVMALVLAFVGFWAGGGGGASGVLQAAVEIFDMIVRLGSNVVSFARLAAFGLTHAVLGWIVWDATTGLWASGPVGAVVAVFVFTLGNAVAFTLEALVAGVQALRLEYYELFSRVFQAQGRPFRPWQVPTDVPTVEES